MNIISKRYLNERIKKYPELEVPLLAWYKKMTQKDYKTPQEIIVDFKDSDLLGGKDNRIIFNIARNKYRLIAGFDFYRNKGFVKWVGLHKDYDKIDPKTIAYQTFTF